MKNRRRERRFLWLSCLLAVGILELGLRALGGAPWTPPAPTFVVTPSPWTVPDARLGWTLRPGEFTFDFAGGPRVSVRHDAEGRRLTPPGRGRILELHGGSFAYGLGLEDAESMGWRLQERLPDHDVRVHAVPAHGPLQAWMRLQELIATDRAPYAMVITYADFHDERVTWNRSWRRALSGSALETRAMPAVRTRAGPPRVEAIDPRLHPLPGAGVSAILARLDRRRDVAEERELHSTDVSRNLLVELHHRAKAHGTLVLVVGLSSDPATRETLRFLGTRGVLTLDAGLDWRDPQNQLGPHDHHPNAAAADHWARAVAERVQGGGRPPGFGSSRPP